MEVIHNGNKIPLSVLRPCRMDITPSMALNMYGSPHLIIPYPLRNEQGDFEDKFQSWIDVIRG